MPNSTPSYAFLPGRRSIIAEIYFPKRLITQGTIHTTLQNGLNDKNVRAYLEKNAKQLRKELKAYPHWFDPNRYRETNDSQHYRDANTAAIARMNMCEQVFFGWSMYEVDGVFLKNDNTTIDEERTQVLKLMFKFKDDKECRHPDIYRAVLYWVLSEYGHTDDYRICGKLECDKFLERYNSWDGEKKEIARDLYASLAPKVAKWIVDCGLFIFGYLVRQFWKAIVDEHRKNRSTPLEDEIWVTSIFHANINVMSLTNESNNNTTKATKTLDSNVRII